MILWVKSNHLGEVSTESLLGRGVRHSKHDHLLLFAGTGDCRAAFEVFHLPHRRPSAAGFVDIGRKLTQKSSKKSSKEVC